MKTTNLALILLALLCLFPSINCHSEFVPHAADPKMRQAPKPLFQKEVNIQVEWQEILVECAPTQLCVQGTLVNSGTQGAGGVKLRVEIGNIKMSKPRVVKIFKLEQPFMGPGDHQDFTFTLDRKTAYKDYKGKPKVIEVGKYNFRVIPIWAGKKDSK